jgi:hypothetical protein
MSREAVRPTTASSPRIPVESMLRVLSLALSVSGRRLSAPAFKSPLYMYDVYEWKTVLRGRERGGGGGVGV